MSDTEDMQDTEEDDAAPDPKKRGLGRGLNALFEDEEEDYFAEDESTGQPSAGPQRIMMGLDQIEPGSYQPRRSFEDDALTELAESISVHGVLQPLIVREKPGFDGTYELIAGERRWRAAQRAQLHEVPVIIKDLDDESALEIALIENLQRQDLNPIEEAQGYKQLIEEFGHTQEKAAGALGKSRSHIANMMRLLNLPTSVRNMVREGQLSAGHARTLVAAENPEELAKQIVAKGLSVREAEALAGESETGQSRKKKPKPKPEKDVDTLALEDEVSAVLGMKVSIDVKGNEGAGTMRIDFKTLDQLDEILHRLSHYPGRQQTG